jgi:hypothetical protein
LILWLSLPFLGFAQNDSTVLTLPNKVDDFCLDQLGNIYLIHNGAVFKTDTAGNVLATYSNKTTGNFSHIDATNPLRIMVFADEFSTVYFFDNQLAVQSVVNLRDYGFNILTVAAAGDGLWCFDQNESYLLKLDNTLRKISQTQPFYLIQNDPLNITSIQSADKWLACMNKGSGIMVFDRLGSYIRTWPAANATSFLIAENMLVYTAENELIFVDLKLFAETGRVKINCNEVKRVQWFHNSFYLLCNSLVKKIPFSK